MVGRKSKFVLGRDSMFGLGKKNKELEALLAGVLNNEANNYKDATQECLKKFEERFCELEEESALNDKQKGYYEGQLAELKQRLEKFTHKDQKPYWAWFIIFSCSFLCIGCSSLEEMEIDNTATRAAENTFTETEAIDNSSVEEEKPDEILEKTESYIDAYIDLSEDTEVEDYEWMQYNDEQVLRVKIQYKEHPVNNYQHKEDYFLFFEQDEKVTNILVVDYEDKGIHYRLGEGTECTNNHGLGEGCGFDAHFEDVTFDGRKDLIISVGNSRHAEYYCAYICENNGFRYEKTFEHIPSYEISNNEKVIYGSDTDGMGYSIDTTYEYRDGEFILIEVTEEWPDGRVESISGNYVKE